MLFYCVESLEFPCRDEVYCRDAMLAGKCKEPLVVAFVSLMRFFLLWCQPLNHRPVMWYLLNVPLSGSTAAANCQDIASLGWSFLIH